MYFLLGLELGAEYGEIYNGFWGYNSLLTGAALGGNLLVLNSQTTVATVVAIVYTTLVQYSIQTVFMKVRESFLTANLRHFARLTRRHISGGPADTDAAVHHSRLIVLKAKKRRGRCDVSTAYAGLLP